MAKAKKNASPEPKREIEALSIEKSSSEIISNTKNIIITILGFSNISPIYSISDLTVETQYMGLDFDISPEISITDDEFIWANHEFVLECDINSSREIDTLISNPLRLSVIENPAEVEAELLMKPSEPPPKTYSPEIVSLSALSAADLTEAITGKPVDRSAFTNSEKDTSKKADKRGTKDSIKKGKASETKKETLKEDIARNKSIEDEPLIAEPWLIGSTTLDLLPLFLGQTEIKENLIVYEPEKLNDDQMIPTNLLPRISIGITIDEGEWISNIENANIFSLTVESIYNIPTVMNDDKQYIVSTFLPSAFAEWEHVVIPGGTFKEKNDMNDIKIWPNISYDGTLGSATKYRLDDCKDTIHNKNDIDVHVLTASDPIIQWNILKRNFLMDEALRELHLKIKKYRHIPLEIYVTSAKEESSDDVPNTSKSGDSKTKAKSEASGKTDKGKKGKGADKKEEEYYLHLMTSIDVATLLYPGVKKCRVVCPLNTYQEKEILQQTGLEDSYFLPKPLVPVESPGKADKKKDDGKKADKKSSKSDKSSKKDTTNVADNKNDLKTSLPLPPPELEPSTPLYNEKGERTFIIVEIELFKPLVPKRELEDLSEELIQLLPPKPEIPKLIISSHLSSLHFADVIKHLMEDLSLQHENYLEAKEKCSCIKGEDENVVTDFIAYLQRSGVYQTYLMTMTRTASIIVNDKFLCDLKVNSNSKEYQNLIADVYAFLIKEMNTVVNEFTNSGIEHVPVSPFKKLDSLLLYAKEATEIGATILANRYYLERIYYDNRNANYWFDYAVFQREIGHKEKSVQCLLESLTIDPNHRYSLLMYGLCLVEKNLYKEAETCFLTMILQNQQWVEGWGAIHLFYSEINNREGADLSLEMANKYLNHPSNNNDYLKEVDDLTWSTNFCPNTIFLRTAMLLLKLRIFIYAEKALAYEKIKNPGICHYYAAVVLYYLQMYDNALCDLHKARELYGINHAIASLTGHCYLALGELEKAKTYYLLVLESYDRPEDVHLTFICLALVWEKVGDSQSARKLLLVVCKLSPTPYTWLAVGILYFKQQDLISAEQCLIQANLCDNRLADIWGFLTLINLEKCCYTEAELCYKQAKKNNIDNKDLITRIKTAWKTFSNK